MPLEPPPLQTPVFADLALKDRVVRFLMNEGTTWGRWLNELRSFVAPTVKVETLDFPNTAAQTSQLLTVNMAGALTTHRPEVIPPTGSVNSGAFYDAVVLAAGVVTVRHNNFSAGAINPASGSFIIVIRKY